MAGLLLDGPTVVVSPLIALQHDQVESIGEHELEGGRAAQLNSTLKASERRDDDRAAEEALVVTVEDDAVVVRFDDGTYRTLELVERDRLLVPKG